MKKTVRIESTTPIKAFMKKDLSIASRDFMAMRFLIMPILLPIISVLLFPPSASITLQNYLGSVVPVFLLSALYELMSAVMLTFGFLNIEITGSSNLGIYSHSSSGSSDWKVKLFNI